MLKRRTEAEHDDEKNGGDENKMKSNDQLGTKKRVEVKMRIYIR